MIWIDEIGEMSTRLYLAKLLIGAVLIALVISLGMIGILKLLGFSINPAIPAALGAIGAATYAARVRMISK